MFTEDELLYLLGKKEALIARLLMERDAQAERIRELQAQLEKKEPEVTRG